MVRLSFVLPCVLSLIACGDDGNVILIDAAVDAAPDVAIDAPSCDLPSKMCGTTCIDVSVDELNCGDCGVECNGGEVCSSTCACAGASVVPVDIPPAGGDPFEGFMSIGGGVTVAFNANLGSGGLNPFLVGFDGDTMTNADIDLSMTTFGDAPFVGVGVGLDINTGNLDTAYAAVSGTLRFTDLCNGHVQGTLTDVTFQGITGDLFSGNVTLDPDGCTFTLAAVAFETGDADCP